MNERKDVKLRNLYEAGKLNSEEFIQELFKSEECDRVRRRIVNENRRRSYIFSKGGYNS